jgi:hypothetical protein
MKKLVFRIVWSGSSGWPYRVEQLRTSWFGLCKKWERVSREESLEDAEAVIAKFLAIGEKEYQ